MPLCLCYKYVQRQSKFQPGCVQIESQGGMETELSPFLKANTDLVERTPVDISLQSAYNSLCEFGEFGRLNMDNFGTGPLIRMGVGLFVTRIL